MSLKDSLMKYKTQQNVIAIKASKKIAKKHKKEVVFDCSILAKGGESVLAHTDSKGKKREIHLSVHTPLTTYPPKYKFHYRNAFGNYIFIKCQKMELAQEICNFLEGVSESGRSKYRVSGCIV